MKHPKIKGAWKKSCTLHDKGKKLYAKSAKLLREVYQLRAKGDKLHAAGCMLYAKAVLRKYGNKAVYDCDTGEIEVRE